jgi:hypothetical protein
MLMQSGTNGFNEHVLHTPIGTGAGIHTSINSQWSSKKKCRPDFRFLLAGYFQELLRNVSVPNWNWQQKDKTTNPSEEGGKEINSVPRGDESNEEFNNLFCNGVIDQKFYVIEFYFKHYYQVVK